jgi:acyl dehydratase
MNNRIVTEDLIRQWAYAMGDPNPLWRDPSYARSTRWGGIIAPPTFESAISYCTAAGKGPDASIRLPGFNNMAAGNRHEYFQVIRPGDSFRIMDKYLGIEERPVKDKPYRLFLESGQRTYINQREEVVAIAIGRALITGTPPWISEDDAQIYRDRKVRHFTKEELDAAYNQYDEQLSGVNRRGNLVRYWDDVNVGEELPTIIKGPTDICDVVSGMVFMMNYGFAIKWAVMRGEKQHHPIDPRTGGYRYRRDWHFEESFAQQMGMPYPFLDGVHVEMMSVHPLTDWMGDDAFVKVIDFQNRRINIIGDINWLKGKVVNKRVDNCEHLVDVELWCENQDSLISAKGMASVRLEARQTQE